MELYCVVSVVMEFLELGKYAKRAIRYDFPLNYLFEKETACSLRWTATRVLQISNRSPIYLSAAWALSIQLSIDNWILISRFPSTHSLWYIFQFLLLFVCCFFLFIHRHFHNINISWIGCCVYTKHKIAHCHNGIKSGRSPWKSIFNENQKCVMLHLLQNN